MQTNTKLFLNANQIKNAVAQKMDSAAFDSWIIDLDFCIQNNVLNLSAQNQFAADFIRSTYLSLIENVAAEFSLDVILNVAGSNSVQLQPANDLKKPPFDPIVKNEIEYTDFNSFIESDENKFAVSAAKKLASGTAEFSPLFIYGPSGCGKTMIANAINNSARGKTIFMNGATFVSEFVRAMKNGAIFSFKDYCRNCDTFIMDDLNALSGKRASSEEFSSLITDLIKMGKNVVLIGGVAPSAMTGFDRKMMGVFSSGLVVDMTGPNDTVRAKMLMRAGLEQCLAENIAQSISNDGHICNGIIKKIKTYTELMNETVNAEIVKKLLGNVLSENKNPKIFVSQMCEKLGVSYDAIIGTSRVARVAHARQMMMFVLKNNTDMSLNEIGRAFGGRNHATVLHGVSQIKIKSESDLILMEQLRELSYS